MKIQVDESRQAPSLDSIREVLSRRFPDYRVRVIGLGRGKSVLVGKTVLVGAKVFVRGKTIALCPDLGNYLVGLLFVLGTGLIGYLFIRPGCVRLTMEIAEYLESLYAAP